ncbi:MAG: DUF1440 domain-containing protein [Acidobacteriaceae bacterium]
MARNIKRNILTADQADLAGIELRGESRKKDAGEGQYWRKPFASGEDWINQGSRWAEKKKVSQADLQDAILGSAPGSDNSRSQGKPEYEDQGSWEHSTTEERSQDFRAEKSDFGGSGNGDKGFSAGGEKRGGNLGISILIGLGGGLAATYVMTQAQSAVKKLKTKPASEKPKSREQQEREVSEQSTVKIADKVSSAVTDHEVPQEQKQSAGNAVHYSFGTLMGGVYGGMASLLDDAPLGTGLLFGIGLWLAADEFVLPQLGLSKSPTERGLKEHAYEASAHAVYGLTLDAVNQLRKRVA